MTGMENSIEEYFFADHSRCAAGDFCDVNFWPIGHSENDAGGSNGKPRFARAHDYEINEPSDTTGLT